MNFKHPFLLTLLILPYLLASQDVSNPQSIEDKSNYLIELTEQNFDQNILSEDDKKWFVMFYVHWCRHCQATMPTLEKIAQYPNDQVSFARVDCDTNPGLTQRYYIQHYPTFLLFYKQEFYPYEGPRTIKAWSEFVNRDFENTGFPASLLDLHKDNFNSKVFANEDSKWMIMFYAPWCSYSKQAMPIFTGLSRTLKGDTSFGRVDCEANPGFNNRLNISGYPTFLLFNKGEIRKIQGPRTLEAWSDFVKGGYKQVTALEENVHSIIYIEPEFRIFGMNPITGTLLIGGCIIAVILFACIIFVSYIKNKDNTGHVQLVDASIDDESRDHTREIEFSPVRTGEGGTISV